MRNYTTLDLLRFNRFANESENKELNGIELVKAYNKKFPELSSKQKLINLCNALKMPELLPKRLTD